MKPPYAESTLYQKYRKTGIDKKKIRTIKECLNACSNFYKVIELDEALMIARKECSKSAGVGDVSAESVISQAEFDALVPIFERDSKLDFYLALESELYDDGKDKFLLIDKEYLCVKNNEFTKDDIPRFIHCKETGEPYDGPYPMEEDWDIFFELDKQRQGKGVYIPDDLMKYADPYFPETPQVEAMRKFLVGLELKVPDRKKATTSVDNQNIMDSMSEQERLNFRANAADAMIYDMHTFIRDVHTPALKAFPVVLEVMNASGYKLSMSEVEKCMDLFTDLSNNTRMPSNGGYTPNELMQKMGRSPRQVMFGSGFGAGFENVMKPFIAPPKVGRNDPCPCGSGKKYKNCCGKGN